VDTEQETKEQVVMVVLEAQDVIMAQPVVLEHLDKVTMAVLVEQTTPTTLVVEAAAVKVPLVEAQATVQLLEQEALDRHHQSLVHL
jgi:hypothetical protein